MMINLHEVITSWS